MKVLLINKFHYLRGGAERYYFSLANALKKAGDKVIFFSMQDENNFDSEYSEYFVKNSSINGSFKQKTNMVIGMRYRREAYKKLLRCLKDTKPDLVIFNNIHKQITCSVIDAIKDYNKDLPIIWIMHDLITVCPAYTMLNGKGEICDKCLKNGLKECIKNKCVKGSKILSYLSYREAKFIKKKGFYNQVDLFICPSQFYERVQSGAKFTSSPIEFLRNPLEDGVFGFSDKNDGYYLYFGRLSKEKGVDVLIDAVKNVDVKLKIVGDGAEKDRLLSLAKENGNIEFLGYKSGEELDRIISRAKAIVIPSLWYENCPYSALEGMAKGKPLIVSDKGGLPELVKEGYNGFIFSDKDGLNQSINKMESLSENEYQKMCENAFSFVKENCDMNKYIQKIKEKYKEIINRK